MFTDETKTVLMPRELTAENGAKALLIGEFYSNLVIACECCDESGYIDGNIDGEICDACSGAGSYTVPVPVSWTTIKAIYDKAVEYYAT